MKRSRRMGGVLGGVLALALASIALVKFAGIGWGAFTSYLENRDKPPMNIAPASAPKLHDGRS